MDEKNTQPKVKQLKIKTDKFKGLIDHLKLLNDGKFTGYVKINYTQGVIARIEKFEEILKKPDD